MIFEHELFVILQCLAFEFCFLSEFGFFEKLVIFISTIYFN